MGRRQRLRFGMRVPGRTFACYRSRCPSAQFFPHGSASQPISRGTSACGSRPILPHRFSLSTSPACVRLTFFPPKKIRTNKGETRASFHTRIGVRDRIDQRSA